MMDNFIFRSAVNMAALRRLQEKLERPKKKSEHLVVYQNGNQIKVILK